MDEEDSSEQRVPLYAKSESQDEQYSPKQLSATFFLLGLGTLLPWNALLSSLDFYTSLHKDAPVAQYITNSYSGPLMISGLLSLTSYMSFETIQSILICFGLLSVVTLAVPCIADSLAATAIATVLIGLVGGLLQSVLYGLVNYFPGGTVTSAFNSGAGAASVLIVSLRIVTRLATGDGDDVEALLPGFRVFFAVCTFLCIACLVSFHRLTRRPEYAAVPRYSNVHLAAAYDTLHDIAKPAACLLFCFQGTMLLFPGIFTRIPVQLDKTHLGSIRTWFPLIVVALFALGDTTGRAFFSSALVLRYPQSLLIFSIARVAVLPIHILQWIGVISLNTTSAFGTVFFHGFINGFIMNMAFVSAPDHTSEEMRENAGRLMFAMLICGLFLGSASGWILDEVLKSFSLY